VRLQHGVLNFKGGVSSRGSSRFDEAMDRYISQQKMYGIFLAFHAEFRMKS